MLTIETLLNDGGLISQPKAYGEDIHASYQSGMQVSSQTSQVFPCSWCEHRMHWASIQVAGQLHTHN